MQGWVFDRSPFYTIKFHFQSHLAMLMLFLYGFALLSWFIPLLNIFACDVIYVLLLLCVFDLLLFKITVLLVPRLILNTKRYKHYVVLKS